MEKTEMLFDAWNEHKKKLEFSRDSKHDARVGEFWRYWEGVNLGNEVSKDGRFRRVCLVLHNRLGNGLLLVAPITTKYHKRMEPYYIEVQNYEHYGLKQCRIIINQIKLIDKNRLFAKLFHGRNLWGFSAKVKHQYWNLIQK